MKMRDAIPARLLEGEEAQWAVNVETQRVDDVEGERDAADTALSAAIAIKAVAQFFDADPEDVFLQALEAAERLGA